MRRDAPHDVDLRFVPKDVGARLLLLRVVRHGRNRKGRLEGKEGRNAAGKDWRRCDGGRGRTGGVETLAF